MRSWLSRLLAAVFSLVVTGPVSLLIGWQALLVGVQDGLAACLAFSGAGLLTGLALLAAHELGHVAAGLAVGLPFVGLTVGPFALALDGDKLRLRLNAAWHRPAAVAVHDAAGASRWRVAAFVVGGPATNLLIGAACLAAAAALNPGPPQGPPNGLRGVALLLPGDWATAWLNLAGLSSLLIGLATLVPGQAAGLRSDGGLLVDLARAERAACRQAPAP